MECFGTTDFDNNGRLITLSEIIISGLHCVYVHNNNNLKCTILPVVIGATGIVTRSLKNNLEAVPGKHSIDSLQETALLGTSHIIRKVLQCEA
jgi:hypothetical protein